MSAKKVLYLFFLIAAFSLYGATVEFRSGTILAAEISQSLPVVKLEKDNVPNRIFARMVVKLPPERKLSMYDYELDAYGRRFKAVAVSVNNGKWISDGEAVENIDGKTRVSLLFEIDGSVIGKRDIETFDIVAVADPKAKTTAVKFKNIKKEKFSQVSGIPASGRMVK